MRETFWKMARFAFFIGFIAFLGGVAGILANRIVLPFASASPFFSRWGIFKKAAENTVIINKTEQVVVREDDSVDTLAAPAAPSVVNILSLKGGREKDSETLQGSGVLMTNDGLISTSRNAILEDASYLVLLSNGSSYQATRVGDDRLTNLTYLKIPATNLPAVSFSNVQDIHAGERLILIANTAEEYRNRYAVGLLGSVDKTFNISDGIAASSEKWEGVYMVDAVAAGSFVGGPAVDYQGKMVGMVEVSRRDGELQPFLLPVSAVRDSLDRAISGELVSRPELGISYVSITKAYALAHGIGRDRGALVFSPSGKQSLAVLSGSPAERAGIRVGDLIIAVNGREINLDYSLPASIGSLKRGDSPILKVIRGGVEQDIQVFFPESGR